jgi:hypothetical protein
MTKREKSINIHNAITHFNKLMFKKKGVVNYDNWTLNLKEVEPELTNVSKEYNIPKKIIILISGIRK